MKTNDLLIVLVDDDPDDLDLLSEAILSLNPAFVIKTARSCDEGLQVIDALQELPRVIVLDYNMPGLLGLDCLKAIRKRPDFRHANVVIFSSAELLPLSTQYQLQTIDARFFQKPSTAKELEIVASEILLLVGQST